MKYLKPGKHKRTKRNLHESNRKYQYQLNKTLKLRRYRNKHKNHRCIKWKKMRNFLKQALSSHTSILLQSENIVVSYHCTNLKTAMSTKGKRKGNKCSQSLKLIRFQIYSNNNIQIYFYKTYFWCLHYESE